MKKVRIEIKLNPWANNGHVISYRRKTKEEGSGEKVLAMEEFTTNEEVSIQNKGSNSYRINHIRQRFPGVIEAAEKKVTIKTKWLLGE